MIADGTLVIYKNKPAIVKDRSDGKFTISLQDGTQVKVRDKDIEPIHPGPVKDFNGIDGHFSDTAVREVWELLLDDGSTFVPLKELAALIFGQYTPAASYGVYCLLKDGLYFSGSIDAIVLRGKEEIAAEEAKRSEKLRDSEERAHFLERLKACIKKTAGHKMDSGDTRFMQDVEALAYGKSTKSRTMKEAGLGETPEDAHALLLNTGFWTGAINPHPSRFGLTLVSAAVCPGEPPAEDRCDLCHLAAFAIDSPWSNDPDDAISIEICDKDAENDSKTILYVHVSDPAASVVPDSPEEKEARDRGTTLYLPEGTIRMLADEALSLFALGLAEKSPALTFKITLDAKSEITDIDIFPSVVKVRRITYEEADREMDAQDTKDAGTLLALNKLAKRNFNRRMAMGAVNIELPEIRITVDEGNVKIEPAVHYRSASLVRECMIIAGEGAGIWAAAKGIAFPYISQEADIPGAVLSGIAGSMQLRRSMRPRVLSTKPGRHQGLGLDTYTQVTSPLRRYTDLLAHMQIRALLRGEKTLAADEVSARLGFSDAAAYAAVQAERATDHHWVMVYLSDKKDSLWDATAIEKKGNRWSVIIPALALETQVPLQKDVSPNENVILILKSVNIPKCEAVFIQKTFFS
jgi:exoribonuclease-2